MYTDVFVPKKLGDDIQLLFKENVSALMEAVNNATLTDAEKERLTKSAETQIDDNLKKLNQMMHDGLHIEANSRVHLMAGMIMAGLGVEGKVAALELSDLHGYTTPSGHDGKVFISIYSGTKYPEQVLSLALLRSCRLLQQNKKGKENRITASLAGITKAFLIRNYGENMTMGLNSNNTSPAYITGRIFAHMESAQRKIDPNNQTTYAKRFFERVMMNPAKTMPELHKSFLLLKNKAKANGMRGLYNSSDKKIMALIDMLDGNYPDHLSEKQKGEYLVGYYQQRSANIKDAEEKKNRKAAKIETNNTDTATTVATQKEK